MEVAGSIPENRNKYKWPTGVMDSAPDYESGGSRFESWVGRMWGLSSVVE